MIQLANCPCCEGYVVACSKCKCSTSKCSDSNEGRAIEFARELGWVTEYQSPTSAAVWVCSNCKAK